MSQPTQAGFLDLLEDLLLPLDFGSANTNGFAGQFGFVRGVRWWSWLPRRRRRSMVRCMLSGFLGMTKSSSLVACLYSSGERTSARCPSSVCKDEIHNAFLLIASWKARKLLYVGLLLGLEMCGISLGAMVKRETIPSSSA